ncbi:hypothetical protein [Nonomuraea sp. JJY05]|uniref:hypothetical protein n=1 Tax=Nonomuraea sp. JJY05 TaxID=3350255 RepID=UPI00373E8503
MRLTIEILRRDLPEPGMEQYAPASHSLLASRNPAFDGVVVIDLSYEDPHPVRIGDTRDLHA